MSASWVVPYDDEEPEYDNEPEEDSSMECDGYRAILLLQRLGKLWRGAS